MKTLLGVLVPLLAIAGPALADETERFSLGGDTFIAGREAAISSSTQNDAFAAGFHVVLSAPVNGDAHAAGFSVDIEGPVSGNVYAGGNTVTISGAVEKDVTAIGSVIDLDGDARISGNLRAAGGNITVDRPVSGSALLAGGTLTLNAPVDGDVSMSAETFNFGPDARVEGRLELRGAERPDVPSSVAPESRITFTKIEKIAIASDAKGVVDTAARGHRTAWIGSVLGAVGVILYGAILLAIFPRRAETGYLTAMGKPWKSFFFGVLAAASFVGLIPVLLASLVGIPLVPVAVVLLVFAALTGFVAGAYFVADRVLGAFNYDTDTLWKRIGALAIGLIAVWILGIIPVLGWLLQFGLGLFGLGALAFSAFGRRIDTGFHREIGATTGL